MSIEEPKRYASVAATRLVLTLMIFVFHAFYIYSATNLENFFPLSAALQGFNFLSAFLCSRKAILSWKDYYQKRFVSLLIPCLAVFVIIVLSTFVFTIVTGPLSFERFLNGFVGVSANGSFLLSFGTFWYIGVMAVLFALVPLFFLTKKKPWLWWILFSLGILEVLAAGHYWQPIVYLPFACGFYYGFKAKNDCLESKSTWQQWLWPLVVLIAGALANYFIRKYATPTTSLEAFLMTVSLRSAQTIIGMALVLLLLCIFRFLGEERTHPFLTFSDRLSYPFFLVHFALMVGAFDLGKIIQPWPLAVLVAFLGSLALSFLISLLTETTMKKLHLKKLAREDHHA